MFPKQRSGVIKYGMYAQRWNPVGGVGTSHDWREKNNEKKRVTIIPRFDSKSSDF